MARQRLHKLTQADVRDPSGVFMSDGGGLYLRTHPGGSKSWIYRYKVNGRVHDLGLGGVNSVTLAMARKKAAQMRLQRGDGQDPRLERLRAKRANEQSMTFAKAAAGFIAARSPGWKSAATAQQADGWVRDYCAPINAMAVDAIETNDVLRVLRPVWFEYPRVGEKLRSLIERVLEYSRVLGYRDENTANPARWKHHLENTLPNPSKVKETTHHASLDWEKIPALMIELEDLGTRTADALRFVILTAARASEVTEAVWDEFDLEAGIWEIPGDRMKGGRPHVVPLSAQALAVLARQPKHGRWVFKGRGGAIGRNTLASLTRRLRDGATTHGFRSSFACWADETTEAADNVIETCLAHSVGSETKKAYRRSSLLDRRRQLLEQWGQHCMPL